MKRAVIAALSFVLLSGAVFGGLWYDRKVQLQKMLDVELGLLGASIQLRLKATDKATLSLQLAESDLRNLSNRWVPGRKKKAEMWNSILHDALEIQMTKGASNGNGRPLDESFVKEFDERLDKMDKN